MSRRRKRGSGVLPELAEPEQKVPRRLRVEGDLHQALSAVLRELRDGRLAAATITRVRVADDLQLARIYVRVGLGVADDEAARRDLLKGLKGAVGRFRAHLGRSLSLRYTPDLRFHYDERPEAVARVDELLAEIQSEQDAAVGTAQDEAAGLDGTKDGDG